MLVFVTMVAMVILVISTVGGGLGHSIISTSHCRHRRRFAGRRVLVRASTDFGAIFTRVSGIFPRRTAFDRGFGNKLFELASECRGGLACRRATDMATFSNNSGFASDVHFCRGPGNVITVMDVRE